ncbi:MAG: helix-hairpin-helix domain-containing protein [Lachnospiraceae bacterium]|nr:helix-hairpin-helix domain-containing protein [Lachnospiraceae bacterium]
MKRILLFFYINFILCFLIACGEKESFVKNGLDDEIETKNVNSEYLYQEHQDEIYAVYVCGAVVNPGVYYLVNDSIKQDALEAAGGFSDGACEEYINLAEHIKDGEQIYFPYEDENMNEASNGYQDAYDAEGKLNINRADREKLMSLPGIGEAKADAILSYRNTYGDFKTIEDIKNITGIKEGVYNKIKDYITVD